MSIPNRQIGWSNESNLLWQISKSIDKLTTTTGTSLSNIISIFNNKQSLAGSSSYFSITQTTTSFVDNTLYSVKPGIKIVRFNQSFDLGEFVVEDLSFNTSVTVTINSGTALNQSVNTGSSQTSLVMNTIQYITGALSLNTSITNFSANNLYAVNSISSQANLSTFSLPSLVYCFGSLQLTSNNVPNVNFNSLQLIGAIFTLSTNTTISSLNLPALTTLYGNLSFSGLTAITSINFPVLTTIINTAGGPAAIIGWTSMGSLTSFSIPSIQIIASNTTGTSLISLTSGTAALTTFNIGTSLLRFEKTTALNTGNWIMTSCALNQTSVDNILVQLAKLDGTNGTTLLSNRIITITGTSSAPSATGNAAKATLVARGCAVTTN
jgi:hypothetical protein